MVSHKTYWKNPEYWRKYQREYIKKNKEKVALRKKKYSQSPAGIWVRLNRNNQRVISRIKFVKWYKLQQKKCIYCGTKENDSFKCWDSKRFQIDRKDNNEPYQIGNMVLACSICNFIKGNYFTYEEMLKIGEVIKEIRKNRG